MKTLFSSITVLLLIQSCNNSKTENSFNNAFNGEKADTINRTDGRGFKQGKWIITDWKATYGSDKPIQVESGDYIDNKKQGIWSYYDSTGKLSRKVEFKDDFPIK